MLLRDAGHQPASHAEILLEAVKRTERYGSA